MPTAAIASQITKSPGKPGGLLPAATAVAAQRNAERHRHDGQRQRERSRDWLARLQPTPGLRKVSRLRDTDGVHFTDTGYRMLGHFVERELRRDIAQARQERAVPLAGDTAEQAQVNPDRAKLKEQSANKDGAKGKPAAKDGVAAPAVTASGAHEQKAESGKVDVKILGPDGTEQVVTVDIVRPAIPASIVELVTRKQSADQAAQMGDVLVDQIPAGSP